MWPRLSPCVTSCIGTVQLLTGLAGVGYKQSTTLETPPTFPSKVVYFISAYSLVSHSLGTRNLPAEKKEPDILSRGALEIKVCVRTYRLFFVSKTGDSLWRRFEPGEYDKAMKRLEATNDLRRQWLQKRSKEAEAPSTA